MGSSGLAKSGSLRLAMLGVVALLAFTGCSSGSGFSAASDQQSMAASAPEKAGAQARGGGATGSGDPSVGGSGDTTTDVAATSSNRRISRASVVVTVPDLTEASDKVRALAATHGGFVSQETVGVSGTTSIDDYSGYSSSYSGGSSPAPGVPDSTSSPLYVRPGEARIVLRVDPDQTTTVMDEIGKVGEESSRWRTDTDVELKLVDLDSRIETKTRSIEDLRTMMGKATEISDLVTLEREIATRTEDLESLKAQKASLDDAVAYSTVTAVLRTAERAEDAATEVGFMGGLKAGWEALLRSLRVLLTAIGALLPFAVVLVVIAWLVKRFVTPRWRARWERRRAERARRRLAAPQAQWNSGGDPAGQVPVGADRRDDDPTPESGPTSTP